MFIGVRGSGLHTQLELLNEKYKIPILNLKEEILKLLEFEKKNRRRQRFLNRTFKPIEVDEDGKPIEDPEIEEENSEFDKKKHELEMILKLMNSLDESFINGNFFDVDQETVIEYK